MVVMDRYVDLLTRLWPLHRTLVSADTDRAIGMIADFSRALGVPAANVLVHEFPSGMPLSTWITPQKYTLRGFGLTQLGASPRRLVDERAISLSIAEYSQPVNRVMEWDELRPHVFYSERRPAAIPFVFKFFYRSNFGFCLPKTVYDTIDQRQKFHARIETEFDAGTLKCLEVILPGRTDDTLLVMANICHPHQVNDSITGVINAVMLLEHFLRHPHHHTIRFGFWPETIGAMAYFTHYRDAVRRFRYAMFTEMLGTGGPHALQLSRQNDTLLDRVAAYTLATRGLPHRSGRYATVLRNDERISNGINLDIPTISLSRYPYSEYHTSDDNPSIIEAARLRESSEVSREILTIVDENVQLMPAESLFGQPFLTRYGLFNDSPNAGGDPARNLNRIMEDVFSYSDGSASLFDIAERFGYSWEDVVGQASGLLEHKLFTARREGER